MIQKARNEGKVVGLVMTDMSAAFNLITNPPDDLPPDGPTLRHLRKDRGMPLHEVADAVNGHATRISELERQLKFDTDLARRVHAYITT